MSNKETVDALKEAQQEKDVFIVEGVKIRVKPVSALLMQEVTYHIKDPKPPIQPNPDKENRMEENPFDPIYLDELRESQTKRGMATSDAMIMFGLELVDGLPSDDGWLRKLKKLEQKGLLDLSGIDFDDTFDRDYAFKKFVVGSSSIIREVTRLSGVSQEDIDASVESFRGDATQ